MVDSKYSKIVMPPFFILKMKYIISHYMHIYTSHYILLESKIGKCGDLPNVNDVLSGFLVLLELAAVYQDILSKGGRHLLSPQVHISSIL